MSKSVSRSSNSSSVRALEGWMPTVAVVGGRSETRFCRGKGNGGHEASPSVGGTELSLEKIVFALRLGGVSKPGDDVPLLLARLLCGVDAGRFLEWDVLELVKEFHGRLYAISAFFVSYVDSW
jgi:hypothetical protein